MSDCARASKFEWDASCELMPDDGQVALRIYPALVDHYWLNKGLGCHQVMLRSVAAAALLRDALNGFLARTAEK